MGSSSIFSSLGAALHSLPPLSSAGRTSSATIYPTTYTHPLVDAYQSRLNSELLGLQDLSGVSYLSAEWLGQALEVCLGAHSRAEELFSHIQQAVLHENKKWVDEQLESTVKLLDVCSALRETITDIKEYQATLQMIVRGLGVFSTENPISAGQLFRARTALGNCKEFLAKKEAQSLQASSGQKISRLDKCSSMLRQIGERLLIMAPTSGNSSKAQFLEILYGSMATTTFVCGVLVAALSFKSRRSLPAAPAHRVRSLSASAALHGLQNKVKEEIDKRRSKGARAPLQELDSVDVAVRHLYDVVNRSMTCKSSGTANEAPELKQSVHSLKKCITELEAGIASFEKQVEKLFRVLIGSRMALLDSISYS